MKNIKKIICLILIFSLAFSGTQNVTAAKKHYSMKSVDWGLGLNNNHATPGGTVPYKSTIPYTLAILKRNAYILLLTVDMKMDTQKKYSIF